MGKVFSLYPFKDSPSSRKKSRRSWDVICALTGLIIICSVLVCFRESYDIGEPAMHGFPLWFLLFLAYPILLIFSIVNVIFGGSGSALVTYVVHGNQAIGLGIIDFLALVVIWAVIRFLILRFFGSRWVQVCCNFMLMIAGWGIIQLFYFLMVFLWHSGGFEPLHHHLKEPEPPPAQITAAESPSASNLELQYRKYELKKHNR